ncbi:MAG: cysteine desulfurase family protein [Candidatus Binatia bacterium]
MTTVYADYAAAAPVRPEARAALLEALDAGLGNPSSIHGAGARARARLEAAREQVAAALGAHPLEVIFTSGATESNNLALVGVTDAANRSCSVAVPATEHASVLAPARALTARGHRVTILSVDGSGRTAPQAVADAAPDLVSVALVNAETGVVQDVAALTAPVRERGGIVHVDAAQAVGVWPVDCATSPIDLLTVSSTKLGGPAGAGALVVRRGTTLVPLQRGGPQEQAFRAGTENVPAIAGFATALAIAVGEQATEHTRLRTLQEQLRAGLAAAWPGLRYTLASTVAAAPHVTHCTLPDVAGEDVVAALDLTGVAIATGSACAAGAAQPSHVLLALGRSHDEALGALRISLGWASTAADVDAVVQALAHVRTRIRVRGERAA